MPKDTTSNVTSAPAPAEQSAPAPAEQSAPGALDTQIVDSFPVKGRLDLRADGNPQARFNLRITDEAAVAAMASLGKHSGFNPTNPRGETWCEVTIPNGADRGKLRASKAFELNIEATLTITEVINDRMRGRLENVTDVSKVSLLNGGRVLQAAPRERQERLGDVGMALARARARQ